MQFFKSNTFTTAAATLHLDATFPNASSPKTYNLEAVKISKWHSRMGFWRSMLVENKLYFTEKFQSTSVKETYTHHLLAPLAS
jgi:hypothetical protein